MRRYKATSGAKRGVSLPVWGECSGRRQQKRGGLWLDCREGGVGPIRTSQECTMLLSSQKRDREERRGGEEKSAKTDGTAQRGKKVWVWCRVKKQGKIAATYSRGPTTVDGQTDTHAGVLYLQSSVEGERWERDVIVITTTTTTREKGQSSCKEPHISQNNTRSEGGGFTNLQV